MKQDPNSEYDCRRQQAIEGNGALRYDYIKNVYVRESISDYQKVKLEKSL